MTIIERMKWPLKLSSKWKNVQQKLNIKLIILQWKLDISEYMTFKSAVFGCFQYSGIQYLDPGLYIGIWNLNIQNSETFKFFYQIWNGLVYSYSPDYFKTWPFKIRKFCMNFKMVFDKMAAICLYFKWLGFRISDPIQNPDHVQTNLFLTVWNPDMSRFQIPTFFVFIL